MAKRKRSPREIRIEREYGSKQRLLDLFAAEFQGTAIKLSVEDAGPEIGLLWVARWDKFEGDGEGPEEAVVDLAMKVV